MTHTCNMKMTYKDMKTVAESLNESNDCAVKAVTIVSSMHYSCVHSVFAQFGRRYRKTTDNVTTFRVLRELQIFVVDVTRKFKAKTVRTLARELPDEGRFLIWTSGHLLAYRNGRICDHTEGKTHRIIKIMKVSF